MRFAGRAYRAHDPRWAFSPLSGESAAIGGGRFNPKGTPALYLSLDPIGAVMEAEHGLSGRLQPLTLCDYDVDCEDIVDLSNEAAQGAAGIAFETLAGAWRDTAEPAPQLLAKRLIADGQAGILVPSFAVRAKGRFTNLVLWRWGPELPHKVRVFDPTGRLPKNQLSWD